MEEPEGEEVSEEFYEPEKLTIIGPDQTAERREIQEAIQRSKGGSRVEIGVEKPVTIPPNRKPSQCNMMIPYYKLTLRGRRKTSESQAKTPDNQQKNEEEI